MPKRDFGPALTLVPFPRFVAREKQLREEYENTVRLVLSQKARAHHHYREARKAEASELLDLYQYHRDQSNRYWRSARSYLKHARFRKDELDG